MRTVIVYDTKYGNTKQVAERIAEGLKEADGMETNLEYVKDVDTMRLSDYDAILIGAPVHMGAPSRTISKFIDNMAKLDLKEKRGAVFDTYLKTDYEKGVKPMESRINQKVPGLKLVVPGLSVQVAGMSGPITEGELPKCTEFGKRIGRELLP